MALNLEPGEAHDLWIGAFRYYLGRATISTHSFMWALVHHWPDLPPHLRDAISRELREAIEYEDSPGIHTRGTLGQEVDARAWRRVLKRIGG